MGEGRDRASRATSFGGVAEAYERGRPTYPLEAVDWLTGQRPGRVVELGAGTGKLTRQLLELGHHVLATDPDEAMLEVLTRELPRVRTVTAGAEDLADVPSRSADVVVAAQAFHWFDPARALPEAARVLKPGGTLALVWNEWDLRVPWVKKLGRLLDVRPEPIDPTDALLDSGLFVEVEHLEARHRQHLDQHTVLDLAASRSGTATEGSERREALLADVAALYDDYGRGMDGMLLPYFTHCWRAQVVELPAEPEPDVHPDGEPRDEMTDTIPRELRGHVRPSGPADLPGRELDDSQMILIDFR